MIYVSVQVESIFLKYIENNMQVVLTCILKKKKLNGEGKI
jgi:hypothetical protein